MNWKEWILREDCDIPNSNLSSDVLSREKYRYSFDKLESNSKSFVEKIEGTVNNEIKLQDDKKLFFIGKRWRKETRLKRRIDRKRKKN